MKKIWNGVCLGLGFLLFGLGAAGAVMPVLPTTPFLLAAAFFFARGSTRFHQWFVGTNLYRRYIERAVKYKAMDRAAKRNLLVMLGIIFVIGFLFSPGFAKIIILLVAAGHFYYFLFRVRTVAHTQQTQKEPEQKEQSAAPCGKMARTEGCE